MLSRRGSEGILNRAREEGANRSENVAGANCRVGEARPGVETDVGGSRVSASSIAASSMKWFPRIIREQFEERALPGSRALLATFSQWPVLNPNGVAPRRSHDRVLSNRARVFPAARKDASPVGLKPVSDRYPRVGHSSQPWALRGNPVGIEETRLLKPRATGGSPSGPGRGAAFSPFSLSPSGKGACRQGLITGVSTMLRYFTEVWSPCK